MLVLSLPDTAGLVTEILVHVQCITGVTVLIVLLHQTGKGIMILNAVKSVVSTCTGLNVSILK